MSHILDKELEYFIAHQDELVAKYRDKTLVIKGSKVVEVCDSPLAAYVKASKKYEPGTFMIQPCSPGPGAYTVSISTQGIFAER
jgi:hypothetical protein